MIRKFFQRIHKRDKVTPLESMYLLSVNGGDIVEFSDKVKLAEYLSWYRTQYNEIHDIKMFRMDMYNLLKL